MNKTLTIIVITLVVVLGMSAIAPAMAHDVTEHKGTSGSFLCPEGFEAKKTTLVGAHPDHNFNGVVCNNGHAIIDDLPCAAVRGLACLL